jgi:hypothetical protein
MLDHPLEPVIGLAEGESRWRVMTSECGDVQRIDAIQISRARIGANLAGAANRTRTCDPVITNDVLYQLSYCGEP